MSQTFKKTLVSASVLAAFAASGVAIADTTIANTNSAGANVAKASNVKLNGITVSVTEAVGASIGTTTGTQLGFSLDNGAKLVSAVATYAGNEFNGSATNTGKLTGLLNTAQASGSRQDFTVNGVTFTVQVFDTGTTAADTLALVGADGSSTNYAYTDGAAPDDDLIVVHVNGTVYGTPKLGAATVTTSVTVTAAEVGEAIQSAVAAYFGAGAVDATATDADVTFFNTTTHTGLALSAAPTVGATTNGTLVSATAGTNNTTIDSSGRLVLKSIVAETTVADPKASVTLSDIRLDTSASTLDTGVNLSIDSSLTTITGVTTANTTKIATPKAVGVAVTATATTVPTLPKGAANNVTGQTVKIVENIAGSLKDSSSAVDEVTITLPAGFDIITAGDVVSSDTSLAAGAGATASNVVKYNVTSSATSVQQNLVLGGVTPFKVLVPTTATTGNVDATVAVKLADGTTSSSTVTLFKVADKGTTNTAVTQAGATLSSFTTLYAGRATQDAKSAVKLAELVGDSLIAGGYVTFTLPSGVTAGKDYVAGDVTVDATGIPNAPTSVTQDDGSTTNEDGKSVIRVNLSGTDAGTSAGNLRLSLADLDLADTAAVGDLNVAIAGNAGATANSVKVAEVLKATNASISGTAPTVSANAAVSLPDVVIQENKATALGAGLVGFYVNPAVVTLATTGVTVKAYKADGTLVAGTITPTVDATNGVVSFTATATTTGTGAYKYVVSGVTGTVASSAAAGDINAVVGGLGATTDTTPTSDEGGKAFKQTVKVAAVVSASAPSYPVATVADQTKLTLTNLPLVAAGDHQGKQGAVYVALIFQGNVFFQAADGSWSAYTGGSNVPAYFTGTLGTTTLNVVPTALDVSAAKGALFVTGYGLGIAGLGNPFDDFIKNARYNVFYTVK